MAGVRIRIAGQTLLEAIVAIGIVSTSIASALTLTTLSLSAEQDSMAAVIGGNLAREAIEVTRTIRDSNWLAGLDFDDGLQEGTANPDYDGILIFDQNKGSWRYHFQADDLTSKRTKVYRQISASQNATVGLYRQFTAAPSGVIDTGFRRLVSLHPICVDTLGIFSVIESGTCSYKKAGVRVTVTVTWTVAGRNHHVVVQDMLYDWH